ncbi:MAG: transposase [Lautropia sp.]
MDTNLIASPGRNRRRRHSAKFKASVIAACQQPGMSMAAVALANGLNANMLRKWVGGQTPTSIDGLRRDPNEAGCRRSA